MEKYTELPLWKRWRYWYALICIFLIYPEIPLFEEYPPLVTAAAAAFILMWFIAIRTDNYTPLVLFITTLCASLIAYPLETIVATVAFYFVAIVFNLLRIITYVQGKIMPTKT